MSNKNKRPILILDANAFIHNIDLVKLHETYDFFSTHEALAEVRDQIARERLSKLPFELKYFSPFESSIKFVKSFASQTGFSTFYGR